MTTMMQKTLFAGRRTFENTGDTARPNDNNASKSGFLKNFMAKKRTGTSTDSAVGSDGGKKAGTGRGLRGVGGRIKRSLSRVNMIKAALDDAITTNDEISVENPSSSPPPPPPASPSPSVRSTKSSSKTKKSPKVSSSKTKKKKESPESPNTKKSKNKITKTKKAAQEQAPMPVLKEEQHEEAPPSSSPPQAVDYDIIQFKLDQANDRMDTMMNELGEAAFASEDFIKLLDERDDYKEQLKKAPVKPERRGIMPKNNREVQPPPEDSNSSQRFRSPSFDSTSMRRRSLGPKKRSSKVCAPRLHELQEAYVPKTFEKTPEDLALLRTSLAKNFLFKKLTDKALEQMIQAFEPQDHFRKGDLIIQQGEEFGEYFYILGHGSVIFEVDGKKVGGTDVPGAPFGELALLYNSARKATVQSDSDKIRLYRVDQVTFRYILQSRSKFKALGMQAVTKVKAMNRLLKLVDLKTMRVDEDSDEDDDDDEQGPIVDMRGKFGTFVRQVSALSLDNSVRSKFSNSSRRGFEQDDNAEQDFMDHSERRMSIRSSMSATSVSVNSFRRNSVLGEGQFGEVWLVQPTVEVINEDIEDLDEEKFALKIQSKDCMNRASMDYSVGDAVKRECDVLSSLCHPFIVDFVRSFEDEENIYMVMGAIHGKELWDYVHRELDDGEWVSGIPEDHAKFYTLLISDTLNFMHKQLICHRDIKPENVMINQNGYPVLVDFGFAKQLPENDTTYTLCGTPKYTAPEIIANEGHGCAVDNWALGVVLYEMVSGENPFWYDGIEDLQLLDDICNQTPYPIQDDAECSETCEDLIMKLLEKYPARRLIGAEIVSHPWFDGLDIHLARKSALPAPWIPPVPSGND